MMYSLSSCPALCRASTSFQPSGSIDVDGRAKPGHDGASTRLFARSARFAFSIALIATAVTSAPAQDYPSRPVELVVPFPAGGGAEIVTRHLSDGLAKRL